VKHAAVVLAFDMCACGVAQRYIGVSLRLSYHGTTSRCVQLAARGGFCCAWRVLLHIGLTGLHILACDAEDSPRSSGGVQQSHRGGT